MDKRQLMLQRIAGFSEKEKLELFDVEELESRLEMAVISIDGAEQGTNGSCNDGSCQNVSCNSGCWA